MARVMVVDNEFNVVYLMKTFLERRGHEVAEAYSGEECLGKLQGAKYDLVLLDVMMPGMDGWEVCKRIKEDLAASSIVVILSACSDPEDKERSFEYAHADAHLSKGLSFKDVATFIDDTLDRGYSSKQNRTISLGSYPGSKPIGH